MSAIFPLSHGIIAGSGSQLAPPFEFLHLWLFGNLPDGSLDPTWGEQTVPNHGTATTQSRVYGLGTSPETTDPAAVTLGGVRCCEFSGAQYMARLNAVNITQPYTFYVLFRMKTIDINPTLWGGVTTGNYVRVSVAGAPQFRAGSLITGTGTVLTGQWYMVTAVGNGASSRIRLDLGTSTIADAGTGNFGTSDKLGSLATPGNYLSGYIAAVAALPSVATEAQDGQVWNYLRAVKGIA